jgi:hypothetical protein
MTIMTPEEIKLNRDRWKACNKARNERENTCFKGGDDNHKAVIATNDDHIKNCDNEYGKAVGL